MDRLSAVIAIAVASLAACDRKSDKVVEPPPSRTNSAKVNAPQGATTEAFCDVHAADDRAAAFRWPELAGGASAPGAATTWRWVNVWATWCKPCIEEMPLIAAWRAKLAAAGTVVDVAFISVDETDAEIEEFRKTHPETPPSLRVADAGKRAAWLEAMGLGDGAIPIQLFVSPANKLRCARAGGIRAKDYDVVAKLLAE